MVKKAMIFIIKALSVVLIVLLLAYVFKICKAFGYNAFSDKAKTGKNSSIKVEATILVSEGESLLKIGEDLESKGIIADKYAFAVGVRFMEGYDQIVAGEYQVDSSMKPSAIISRLSKKEGKQ